MRKLIFSVVALSMLLPSHSVQAEAPAQQRIKAAQELQNTFDKSSLNCFQLKFFVRGKNCDILHIEGYVNLEEEMMEAIGYGTVIYGKIQPGGVNNFAFSRGFSDVAYSNSDDNKYVISGSTKPTRDQVKAMDICTDQIASQLTGTVGNLPVASTTPQFEQLSWPKAIAGEKLYDGSYQHVATIVSIDRVEDIIVIKFEQSGSVEPKKLSAIAPYWYVKK